MAYIPESGLEQGSGDQEFALERANRKKKREIPQGIDLGPIMFASLAILMLAFFILLNALSTIDTKRRIKVLGSLQGTFGIFSGGASIKGGAWNQQGRLRNPAKAICRLVVDVQGFRQGQGIFRRSIY